MTDQQWQTQQWGEQQQGYGYGQPAAEASPLERAKTRYADVAQPGLDPGNRPAGWREGERPDHKTTWDLEDITGNPGHRNCNPNAPVEQPMEASAEVAPPQVETRSLPPGELHSINEPPGSDVLPAEETPPEGTTLPGQPPESRGDVSAAPQAPPGYRWEFNPERNWYLVPDTQPQPVRPY